MMKIYRFHNIPCKNRLSSAYCRSFPLQKLTFLMCLFQSNHRNPQNKNISLSPFSSQRFLLQPRPHFFCELLLHDYPKQHNSHKFLRIYPENRHPQDTIQNPCSFAPKYFQSIFSNIFPLYIPGQ